MAESDQQSTEQDDSEETDDLELKSIGDFEDEMEVEAMNTISTKSHGHAIRDAS